MMANPLKGRTESSFKGSQRNNGMRCGTCMFRSHFPRWLLFRRPTFKCMSYKTNIENLR
ncbi:hypothetical protein SOVF_181390 [Spinacia oleracea]|nr:hypothetical protein SOVF_181390 [Spinacia oleracea]